MDQETRNTSGQTEKKVYVEPTLEKRETLQNVTEGQLPVVTG
jgi:hypothetical protein